MSVIASPQAILAASKAARLAKARPGAAQHTPAPQGSLDGPWIGQLPDYSSQPGNPYQPGYGPFLPRPSDTFTAGAFAPFSPILPVPLDQPPPGAERPQPRRWQYPVGWNLPIGQPGSEGYKLTSFATLKSLSEMYSILRRCLQIRKQEIRALDWDIVLTKDAAKAYRGDRKAMRDFGERQAKAKAWFRRPDPNYFSFSSWLDAALDQVFVYDALSLYMCPVRGRGMGKGLLGSDLDALWLIDGSGIRPLAGLHGEVPAPPAPAWQQFEYGVPRADYTMMLGGRDLMENGIDAKDLKSELRGDQMMYLPFVPRTDSPYGFSLVEMCLIPVMTGLQKQAYQLDYFNESSVPRVYISPGDLNTTPNQIRELQLALNAVSGDLGNFFKVTVLPAGSKVMPQKEMQIVDQADEWIANEVAMTCGIRPTEIGVIPQVSTVASPFAAREMAQSSRALHDRVDTKPTLKFITEIFDTILQVVCGQQDMRFLFSGMEEQADKSAAVDAGIKQIQSGAISIDEFRDDQGLTPWGYPETQGPIVFTPMGPIPLFEGVQNALAAQEARQQPQSGAHSAAEGATGKKPAKAITQGANASGRPGSVTERQASRGGALAPQHATGTGAPGTATGKSASVFEGGTSEGQTESRTTAGQLASRTTGSFAGWETPGPGGAFGVPGASRAAMAELQALTRHLRKGRAITTWEPRHLSARVMAQVSEDLAKGLTPEQVLTITAPLLLKAGPNPGPKAQPLSQSQQQALAQQYAAQIQAAFTAAIAAAGLLIAQWAAGTLAVTAAVLAGMIIAEIRKRLQRVLAWLWKAAWKAAVADAPAQDRKALKAALEAFLATVGENWAFLIASTRSGDLLKAITDALKAGDPEAVTALLHDLLDVDMRPDLIAITEVMRAWNAALLAAMKLAGVAYKTWQTMRDGKVCARCLANQNAGPIPLDGTFPSGDKHPGAHPRCRCYLAAWTPPANGSRTPPKAAKVLRRQVDTNGQEFWGDAPPLEANAAGGGATGPYPHRADGSPQQDIPGGVPGATAGGEPPRRDFSSVQPHVLSLPSSDDGEWGEAAGTGSVPQKDFPAPYMDGWWPGPHGHGTQQAGTSSPGGGERGRPPNPVGKAADAAAFLKGAPKAKASAVFAQLRANYPASSIAWVKRVKWVVAEVPLEDIDWSSVDRWAAHHQQAKVDQFATQLQAHKTVDPAVGIIQPGEHHVRVVDGHHRSLACQKLGWPSRMYVGYVTDEATSHAAEEAHLYQVHQGNDPANKAAEPAYVGGLAVRAADTGRVLMLQRAVTEDDPAAGMWEFPGGHAEPGETLLQAGLREWGEEVGIHPPRGSLTGRWASANGIYEGFVMTVPSEDAVDIENGRDQVVNPDGDTFESIAWWDPAQVAGNPAVRPELVADLPAVMEALGGDVAKSAETPMLEVTPRILGPEGLWHTPDRHVGGKQKLPDYIEQVAGALMDQQGMGESEAIATAINAIKRWAAGDLHWGRGKVTPAVIAASQDALRQWEDLKASHH